MKLDDWLKAEKKTSAEFARLSGIADRQAVHKYRHGERFPTPENLQRIRRATGGAVTANDFADQHAPQSSPPPKIARKPKPAAKPKGKRWGMAEFDPTAPMAKLKPAPKSKPKPKRARAAAPAESEPRQGKAA
jgi:transcriptional regulator with XRE-family HTH domain